MREIRARDQRVEVDARFDVHVLEHVHEIFGHDVARRSRRVRTAPETADRCVEPRHGAFQCRQHIREPRAARVVEVQGDGVGRNPDGAERVEQSVHPRRRGHARRVAETHAVRAGITQLRRDRRDPQLGHVALVRAAERGRHDRLHRRLRRVRERRQLPRSHDRILDRPIHVLAVVRLTRAHDDLDLVNSRGERHLGTTNVGYQRAVRDARYTGDACHNVGGAGHRRDRGGRDKRDGFDLPQSRRAQRVDQADTVRDRDDGLVLQAITRADLTDLDAHRPPGHPGEVTGRLAADRPEPSGVTETQLKHHLLAEP